MEIPAVLKDKIDQDSELSALVQFANSKITNHITANPLIFFPEYTDHSASHFEDVLRAAVSIATQESIDALTAEDAAALVLSAFLHDFGMYLTRDGFLSLIQSGSRWEGVQGLDQESWSDLWDQFLSEASRFDGRKLASLFGSAHASVRVPPADPKEWEDRDYLLIGEFLRRHHPRLAHEIAIYGMPGIKGDTVPVILADSERLQFFSDVSGLIARSHGTEMRPMLTYIKEKYANDVDPRRIRVCFLITLLRIGDYLQIQESRAPSGRTEVSTFTSPYSGSEWRVHQSVQDIHTSDSDPEAVTIIADPKDVESYLKLSVWLSGLQNELDKSWAILGEMFGRQKHPLCSLGLKVRRIKSNLDKAEDFAKRAEYVPRKISFQTANSDLLKLLVGPLYGNDSSIGFRELIQNAVDAVREYKNICKRNLSYSFYDDGNPDVILSVIFNSNGDVEAVEISDRGVGMTLDILQNYFLRAGASFRKSEQWRMQHEDVDGNSTVLRAGRFGVGALAAFLLGDEIEVVTRHYSSAEDEAFKFRARIDDEAINVRRTTAARGTTIKVFVPARMANRVKQASRPSYTGKIGYDSGLGWFFGEWPNVSRVVSGRKLEVEEGTTLPTSPIEDNFPWRRVNVGSVDIFWSFGLGPALSVNGIVLDSRSHVFSRHSVISEPFGSPKIALVDPNGDVDINLQRDSANLSKYREQVTTSIIDDLMMHALLMGPDGPEGGFFYGLYPGFSSKFYRGSGASWVLTKRGFAFFDEAIISDLATCSVLFGIGGPIGYEGWGQSAVDAMVEGDVVVSLAPNAFARGGNKKKGILHDAMMAPPGSSYVRTAPRTLMVPETVIKTVYQYRPGRALAAELNKLVPSAVPGWKLYGKLPAARISTEITNRDVDGLAKDLIVFSEGDVNSKAPKTEVRDSLVARRWIEVLGTYVIPFDKEQRTELLHKVEKINPEVYRKAMLEFEALGDKRRMHERETEESELDVYED